MQSHNRGRGEPFIFLLQMVLDTRPWDTDWIFSESAALGHVKPHCLATRGYLFPLACPYQQRVQQSGAGLHCFPMAAHLSKLVKRKSSASASLPGSATSNALLLLLLLLPLPTTDWACAE